MSDDKIDIFRPFGPSIAKIKIPEKLILSLNKYVDKIIIDDEKSKKLDYGKNLAGNVKQEFIIEPNELRSSGLANFLGSAVQKWIKSTDNKKITTFSITSSWVVRQFENEYNPIHYHGGHVSGVGYLKLPKNFGEQFQSGKKANPNGQLSFVHGSRMFNSHSHFEIKPEVGDFYLFPNYLMHTVYPFYSSGERRSLSFNSVINQEIYDVFSNI